MKNMFVLCTETEMVLSGFPQGVLAGDKWWLCGVKCAAHGHKRSTLTAPCVVTGVNIKPEEERSCRLARTRGSR